MASFDETVSEVLVGTADLGVGSNAAVDLRKGLASPMIPLGSELMSTRDALVYEHPDVASQEQKWKKYQQLYEASDIYQYIHRHLRETDQMFRQRVARGYFYNYVASIVDLYIDYIFHAPILRQFDSTQVPFLEEIYADADLAGTKYTVLIKNAATFAQIMGHCGVLVDCPKGPKGGYANEAERLAANHRPYLTLIRADQIKDWALDEYGNFNWVKIEVDKADDGRDFMHKVDQERRHFFIWSRTDWQEWVVTTHDAVMVDSDVHGLGMVPLVIVRNERMVRHKWFGLSAVRDIADINIAILNWASLGDEEVFERCLNILAMERGEGDAATELSHHNVLEYDPGAHPPTYLTPGSSPLDLIGKWIDRAKEEIYRLAHMGGSVGQKSMHHATSGIAYAFEFNETNQALVTKAMNLEQAEIEIHRLICAWVGQDFDGVISYPSEFGVQDFLLELQMLAEARASFTSSTAVKELENKVISKMFALDSAELREKIKEEIEESPNVLNQDIVQGQTQPLSFYKETAASKGAF